MISQPSRQCTVELQALPSRIRQVRRIVSAQLRYWQLDPLIDQAALGVTELLTNVHRHAQPDKMCTVDIKLLLDRLTVAVHDHDPRLPTIKEADPLDMCGRGLALIEAVSESWGVRAEGDAGKVIWFTLPASAAAPPRHPLYGATTDGPFSVTSFANSSFADIRAVSGERDHTAARSAHGGRPGGGPPG
ncbi:ATP-binding protein, partial [Streptomyces niveus]|uniref:ATP-binding protein n=1 Tax=Streptomyces niveus TaxID=193462 RepID=UPI003695D0F1